MTTTPPASTSPGELPKAYRPAGFEAATYERWLAADVFAPDGTGSRADPSLPPEQKPFGSKVLVNACTPYKYLGQPPIRTHVRQSVYDRVASRWSELGFKTQAPALARFHAEPPAK